MTDTQQRLFLIHSFQKEMPQYASLQIPPNAEEQHKLIRALMNVRPPLPADEELLRVQDAYLQGLLREKVITAAESLPPCPHDPRISLWQGDITTLRADAIVNAANRALLGCFVPLHRCIDNAIHSCAGIQLRLACQELMEIQGHEEPTGTAKLTSGYNLPARYVLHTVGPIIRETPTPAQRKELADCYRSCLSLAAENGLRTLAFCCISTGEFHFPGREAAEIAVRTVREFLLTDNLLQRVVLNVFTDTDQQYYQELLHA
jgi:O-acetyl-ADP-ribose deacetylase (regulator of RNase III)